MPRVKRVHLLVLLQLAPVTPTGLVVLAVGVIVATLRAAEFPSPPSSIGTAARDQQGQKEVLDLAFPQGLDPGTPSFSPSAP